MKKNKQKQLLTMDALEKIALQTLASPPRKPNLSFTDYLSRSTYTMRIKPLEFHEGSIVIKGFTLKDLLTPDRVLFKSRHNSHSIKIIDSLITSELAILYLKHSPLKYSHSKKYELLFKIRTVYTGNGIMDQLQVIDPSRTCTLIPPTF